MPETNEQRIARIENYARNLAFYANLFEDHQWQTRYIATGVFSLTLREIARYLRGQSPSETAFHALFGPEAAHAALPNPQVRPEQPDAQQEGATDNSGEFTGTDDDLIPRPVVDAMRKHLNEIDRDRGYSRGTEKGAREGEEMTPAEIARKLVQSRDLNRAVYTLEERIAMALERQEERIRELERQFGDAHETFAKTHRRALVAEQANKELLYVLGIMIASAVPHPIEHPTMTDAWSLARAALSKHGGAGEAR